MKPVPSTAVDQQTVEALLESGEFDPFWYDDTFPDVRLSGLAPVEHYLMIGQRLGRAGTAKSEANDGVTPRSRKRPSSE